MEEHIQENIHEKRAYKHTRKEDYTKTYKEKEHA